MPDDFGDLLPRNLWYPGHMLKAETAMRNALSLVDMVVLLVDARAPMATRNPRLEQRLIQRPRLLVANKADLAAPFISRRWKEAFAARGEELLLLDASRLRKPEALVRQWRDFALEQRRRRGATRPLLRPVRMMVVGIPNIGKSTLVNRLKERNVAKVADKPGVTRSNQWVTLAGGEVELLDTPGVLWPQLRDKAQELLLTTLGNIPDGSTDPILTATFLLERLRSLPIRDPLAPLGLPIVPDSPQEILEALARRRGMLSNGGEPSLPKAAAALLKQFRSGGLGRITLEPPPAQAEAPDAPGKEAPQAPEGTAPDAPEPHP